MVFESVYLGGIITGILLVFLWDILTDKYKDKYKGSFLSIIISVGRKKKKKQLYVVEDVNQFKKGMIVETYGENDEG